MAEYFGYNTALWIKESASFKSTEDMAAGTRYAMYVRPGVSLMQHLALIETKHIRANRFQQTAESQRGLESVDGSFGFVVPYSGSFGMFVKHVLGKVTTPAPAGGVYTHTFDFNDLLFEGLSMAFNVAGSTWNYHGCQIESLKLSCNVGEPLVCEIGIVGSFEAVVAAIAAVEPVAPLATDPYCMGHHCVVLLAGSPYDFTGFDLEYTNGIDTSGDKAYELGVSTPVNLIATAGHLTGTLKRRIRQDANVGEATRFHELMEEDAGPAVQMTFTNPDDSDYTFVVNLLCKLDDPTHVPDGQGIIIEEVQLRSVILDHAQSNMVITDKIETPVTATGAYNG